jgi:hypothetical protein
MQVALTPWFGERDLTNQVLCIPLIPMYHGMRSASLIPIVETVSAATGIAQILWAVSCIIYP